MMTDEEKMEKLFNTTRIDPITNEKLHVIKAKKPEFYDDGVSLRTENIVINKDNIQKNYESNDYIEKDLNNIEKYKVADDEVTQTINIPTKKINQKKDSSVVIGSPNKKNKKNKKLRITSIIIWIISMIINFFFCYLIIRTNILPNKYLIAIIAFVTILLIIHGILILKKNKKWIYILFDIIAVVICSGELYMIPKVYDFVNFLNKNLTTNYEYYEYDIIVSSASNYNSVSDLSGVTLDVYNDLGDDSTDIEDNLKSTITNPVINYNTDVNSMMNSVITNTTKVVVANSAYYDAMQDADENYEKEVKIIGTITIKKEKEVETVDVNVTKESFAVYISGIDTRTNSLPKKSLSDVNIIMAVNPNTHEILLIHIPRDYYVQLAGTTGLKDKLTHAGTFGGIQESMSTVENLLEIKIPYYMRVNFNAVVKLVNAVGGITIYNDQTFTVVPYTDSSCKFKPGYNFNVSGKCTLAFARERHAYSTGDRHRGENQEQVITTLINTLTSSKTLLSDYDNILDAMDGTFETNFSTDSLTSLVKMQLNDMSTWTITSYNLDGTGAYEYTHSYPNQKLYVMEPDQKTVKEAITKLDEVLGTN